MNDEERFYALGYADGRYARYDFSGNYIGAPVVVAFVQQVALTQACYTAAGDYGQGASYQAGFVAGWQEGPLQRIVCAHCGLGEAWHASTCTRVQAEIRELADADDPWAVSYLAACNG